MTEGEDEAMGDDGTARWAPANGGATAGRTDHNSAGAADAEDLDPSDHPGSEDALGAVGGHDRSGGFGRRDEAGTGGGEDRDGRPGADGSGGGGEREDPGGTDVHDRARQGVEHLQAAARELIAAARAALDVAEEVVNDPETVGSLAGVLAGLSDMARRVRGGGWPPSGASEPSPEDERQAKVERIRVT